MELGLRGRRAVVTGASKGIGFACADRLAQEGCDLAIVARDPAMLALSRDRLARHGTEVTAHPLDLSSAAGVEEVAALAPDADILVNNAGAIPGGRIDEIDEARWRAAWDLKVFGYINVSRRFYAAMASRGHGVIVNVIGAAGERVDAGYIAVSAGNAALIAFTRALGGSSAKDGIRVVGINPGPVLTDRLETLLRARAAGATGDPERWRDYVATLPFGRAAAPDEIGALAAFLASDLSGYTTGVTFTVDGGMGACGAAY